MEGEETAAGAHEALGGELEVGVGGGGVELGLGGEDAVVPVAQLGVHGHRPGSSVVAVLMVGRPRCRRCSVQAGGSGLRSFSRVRPSGWLPSRMAWVTSGAKQARLMVVASSRAAAGAVLAHHSLDSHVRVDET